MWPMPSQTGERRSTFPVVAMFPSIPRQTENLTQVVCLLDRQPMADDEQASRANHGAGRSSFMDSLVGPPCVVGTYAALSYHSLERRTSGPICPPTLMGIHYLTPIRLARVMSTSWMIGIVLKQLTFPTNLYITRAYVYRAIALNGLSCVAEIGSL